MIYQIISAIQNLWSKYKTLIIINGAIIFLILIFVIPYFAPKPALNIQSPRLDSAEKTINGVDITLALQEPNVPQQLPLYRLETYKQDADIFNDIAQRLGINTVLAPTLRVNDSGENLSLDEVSHRITYGKSTFDHNSDQPAPVQNQTPLNLDIAKKLTSEWLNKVGFTDIEINALETRYYISTDPYEGFEEAEPAKANIIRFTFSRKLSNIPLSLGASTNEPSFITVSNDGVIQADFPSFIATFSKDREKTLLPFSSVIDNVKAGKYSFTTAIEAVAKDPADIRPVSFELTSAVLHYRVDTTQNAAVPYWDLSGSATLKSSEDVPIDITTPAIAL